MVCLIKSKYKAELKHYADILGSEEAAYYVLASNNGFTLDKTPQGDPSDLYNFLLEVGGSEEQAILNKAIAYTPKFLEQNGNWLENYVTEPAAYTLNNRERYTDGSSLSEVLNDSGRYIEACQRLEDANILDHELIAAAAIGHARDEFTEKYINHWLETHKDSTQFERTMAKLSADQTWTLNKIDELMSKTREVLGKRLGLKSKIIDGRPVFYTDSKDENQKIRVEFVNSLTNGEYTDTNGVVKKGMFYDKSDVDSTYNLILLSLEDGDPTTLIHELSHSYIRRFWNSEPIQRALRVVDAETPGRLTSKEIEEILVSDITDRVINKKTNKFINGFRKVMRFLTAGTMFKDKLEIRDLITSYFILNKDLSYQQAEQITYEMFKGPVNQASYTMTEADTFEGIVRGLKRKLKALQATDASTSEILATKQAIQKMEQRNPGVSSDVQASVEDFLNLAIDEVVQAQRLLANVTQNGIDSVNLEEFINLRSNVIQYYQAMLNQHINPLIINNKASYLQRGTVMYDQFSKMSMIVADIAAQYDNILSRYVDKIIDDYCEANVDVGDRAKFSYNAKLWVRNEINDGRLQMGELLLGGTTSSRSPIVRMVEFMVSDCNTRVRIETGTLGHKLKKLYDKCSPLVSFSNFMRNFIELDENGKPTGYFLRDINYGKFYDERDAFITSLDQKYDVLVELDEDGKEQRFWKSDSDWKDYQDELDDWYEKHAHRKYTAEYYKDQRKYLSRDTIEALNSINDRINTILNKCTDPKTKIPYTFELSIEDRQQLRKLNDDKKQLANPYIITLDANGNIINIQEKSGDAKRMADELNQWNKVKAKQFSYKADLAKFAQVEQYILNKYGASSIEMARFKEDYIITEINSLLWDEIGSTTYRDANVQRRVNDLKAKRSAILSVAYGGKKGYIMPDLSKLNDKAFAELKKIDIELDQLDADPSKLYVPNLITNTDFKDIFTFSPVQNIQTGQDYLHYLEQQALSQTSYNANSLQQYYQKYYYTDRSGHTKPLSVFFYIRPIRKIQNLTGGMSVETIIDNPTGAFQDVSGSTLYIDNNWDPSSNISIQPDRSIYDNSERYNKVMSNPNMRAFYDALIEAMDDAYKKLPHYHEDAKYLMPQMANKELGKLAGGWRDIYGAIRGIAALNDDIEINMSQTLRPDGTPVKLLPIRWNRRNKDINISTDVLYTVVAFSKMASEYKEKRRIMPKIEAIISESKRYPTGEDRSPSDQTRKLEQYADANIYGNYKKPLLKDKYGDAAGDAERRVSQFLSGILSMAHMKLMSRNFRAILKNLIDSSLTMLSEIGGGKYFTWKDFIYGTSYAFKDIIKAGISIGNANTRSKLAAAMQFNGASDTIDEIFQHNNNSYVVRFFKKFFCMGEYTLIDYLVKGGVTAMVYHHHRLMINPRTGKREFLTQEQAMYAYTAAGLSAKEGSEKWSNSKITLWDAYDLSDDGNFVLTRFKDAIRPSDSNGNISTKIETRVAGTIRERGSVINGVLDTANKGKLHSNYLGAAFLQMRGWMVSHAFDYFKDGHDFADFVKASQSNKKLNAKVRNADQIILEDEDFEYRGQYNFETGTIERGTLRGIIKAVARVMTNIARLNEIMKVHKPTRNEQYQVKRLTFSMIGLALCIFASTWVGKRLEDDPDDELNNFLYSTVVAATSERATTIPGAQLLTSLDVIRQPFIAYTLVQDFPSVLNLIADGYEAATYDEYNSSSWPQYNQTINTGSYKGLETWQRDVLKASAELYPYVNVNNVIKNMRKESNRSSANYYRSIFPTDVLTYKPQINQTNSDQHWTGKIWDWFTDAAYR